MRAILIRVALPTIHCITIIATVIGSSFNDDKHQVIMDFAILSGSLHLGIRHLIRATRLFEPIAQI